MARPAKGDRRVRFREDAKAPKPDPKPAPKPQRPTKKSK